MIIFTWNIYRCNCNLFLSWK